MLSQRSKNGVIDSKELTTYAYNKNGQIIRREHGGSLGWDVYDVDKTKEENENINKD